MTTHKEKDDELKTLKAKLKEALSELKTIKASSKETVDANFSDKGLSVVLRNGQYVILDLDIDLETGAAKICAESKPSKNYPVVAHLTLQKLSEEILLVARKKKMKL